MFDALDYPFFQRALAAALSASVACGIVGSYVVVRRIASISGGLSHAAFGGVGLGYLLGFDPMLGATGFALACGVGLGAAERKLRHGLDTLIAMVWAVGMALGILFVSLAPGYAPDLMSYLFGSLLFVPARYVGMVLLLDLLIVVTVALLFKEFQAVCFDEEGARIVGVPVGLIQQILLALVALAVVTLIRVVGVILVIALLTIPAAIARQWADTLLKTMGIAILVGAACSSGGLFLSYWLADWFEANLPTGPLIVLLAVLAYGLSTLLRAVAERGAAGSRIATVSLLLLTVAVGCAAPRSTDKPIVAVSVEPQAYFVEQIAGDLVQVVVMVPPGANPATYSPTVHQIQALSAAVLYFKVGHPGFAFERAWLDSMLQVETELEVVDGALHSPCTTGDPHLWVAPGCVRVMAANLTQGLERVLPEQRAVLRANFAGFERRIDTLQKEIGDALQRHAGRGFLVYHPSWGCLAEEYALEQIAIEREGKEPSPHDLAELIAAAKHDQLRVVFVQPQHSERAAEMVAEAIGGRVVPADPLARNWPQNLTAFVATLVESFDD